MRKISVLLAVILVMAFPVLANINQNAGLSNGGPMGNNLDLSQYANSASGNSVSSNSGSRAGNGGTAIANSGSGFPGGGMLPDCDAIAKSTGDFAVKMGCVKINTMEAIAKFGNNRNNHEKQNRR